MLPVQRLVPDICECLSESTGLVLLAPPGAGKTTTVPPALLGFLPGRILVLEPRRLAARMAARFVSTRLGTPVGEVVGYQVRFEEQVRPSTRLVYMTDGVLPRLLLSNPRLEGISCVIFDEFHERRLDSDLSLALVRHLQQTERPDLRVLVMSATLDPSPIAAFLGTSLVLRAHGRQFQVEVAYRPSHHPLPVQVRQVVEDLARSGLEGDTLVFLPGAAEIRACQRSCEHLASCYGLLVCPLHGDLPPEDQDRAVSPADRPKLILSTNVAESSITIDGVTTVIDSGMVRFRAFSPWSGLPHLALKRACRASCDQRAGRAGRGRPGRVIRLYSEDDYARRPFHELPEIQREDISTILLLLCALGLTPEQLPWLDPPPLVALESAHKLLRTLRAVDHTGRLTSVGRRMVKLPLHPRLSRLLVECKRLGARWHGYAAAARLSTGEPIRLRASASSESDLLTLLDSPPTPQAKLAFRQLTAGELLRAEDSSEEGFLRSLLAAFPDRVARRRSGCDLLLSSGRSAMLSRDSSVQQAEWVVCIEIEKRCETGVPLVRLASAIHPEWLLELLPEALTEHSALEWNAREQRVESVSALRYGQLELVGSRTPAPLDTAAQQMLFEKAWEVGWAGFASLEPLLSRWEFAARLGAIRPLEEEDLKATLFLLCAGCRSFADLRQTCAAGSFKRALLARLTPAELRALDEVAPQRIRLPSGRKLRVHYPPTGQPWVEGMIQDFFGLRETPTVGKGSVRLQLRLLAPNRRPVQTTSDLTGFWQRLYPQLRRELSRRYPRHAWPEDPV